MRRPSLALLVSVLASTTGATGAAAAIFSLDDPDNTGAATNWVGSKPQLDPFGNWAVFIADLETDNLHELWSSPLAGGEPNRLSGAMQMGDSIHQFAISPDGTFVAFVGRIQGASVDELYIVDITGGTPVKRNHTLANGETVSDVAISADSQWLVYKALVAADSSYQLFRVDVSGANAHQYEYSIATTCVPSVLYFTLSPDGADVAFSVNFTQCPGEPFTGMYLLRAGIADTTADLVAGTGQGGIVSNFQWSTPLSPATPLLLFMLDLDGVGTTYAMELKWDDGTLPAPHNVISGSIVAGGNVLTFSPVPFSSYVVFLADREIDEKLELYRTTAGVPSVVQVPIQLHEELPTSLAGDHRLTADGTRVAFTQEGDPGGELLRSASVDAPGGSSNLLETVLAPGDFSRLHVAGGNVVFVADRDAPGREELFAVPAIGGTVVRLNPTGNELVTDWDVVEAQAFSPDHSVVHYFYSTELLIPPFTRAISVRSATLPAGPSRLLGPAINPDAGFYFENELFAPLDSRRAVSRGAATTPGRRQLYISDACLYCDSFEGTGDGLSRWD